MSSILAQRIRARRRALDVSQRELAQRTGYTQAQISKYERGENEPSIEMVFTLARILETSADYLLGISDDESASRESDLADFSMISGRDILKMTIADILRAEGYDITEKYDREAVRAAEIIQQLPPEQRLIALGILEQFIGPAKQQETA